MNFFFFKITMNCELVGCFPFAVVGRRPEWQFCLCREIKFPENAKEVNKLLCISR